jgi:hypothetical protein
MAPIYQRDRPWRVLSQRSLAESRVIQSPAVGQVETHDIVKRVADANQVLQDNMAAAFEYGRGRRETSMGRVSRIDHHPDSLRDVRCRFLASRLAAIACGSLALSALLGGCTELSSCGAERAHCPQLPERRGLRRRERARAVRHAAFDGRLPSRRGVRVEYDRESTDPHLA